MVSFASVVYLALVCAGVILTINLAKRAWQHRAIRIMVLVTMLAAGALLLFSGVSGRHRLSPQILHGPSNPKMAIRDAAVSAREFARDRIQDGRSAAHKAKVILRDKVTELRQSETIQEYEAMLTAEASADGDGAGVFALIQPNGNHERALNWRIVTGSALWSLIAAAALGAFLYFSYILLDASTRGHFSWSLRFAAVGCFGVIYTAMALLRH